MLGLKEKKKTLRAPFIELTTFHLFKPSEPLDLSNLMVFPLTNIKNHWMSIAALQWNL